MEWASQVFLAAPCHEMKLPPLRQATGSAKALHLWALCSAGAAVHATHSHCSVLMARSLERSDMVSMLAVSAQGSAGLPVVAAIGQISALHLEQGLSAKNLSQSVS